MTIPMNKDYFSYHLLEMVEQRQPIDEALLHKSNISLRDTQGKNALYWAIKNKSTHNVSLLLKHAVPFMVERHTLHALFHAVECENMEALVLLFKFGQNINLQNEQGESLLMKALEKESLLMVQYLIANNIDIDLIDNNHNKAIDYAKKCKNKRIYEMVYYKILSRPSIVTKNDSTGCGFGQDTLCASKKEI